jgi:hypothetical protein
MGGAPGAKSFDFTALSMNAADFVANDRERSPIA